MPPESKKTFDHLTALHEKYYRQELRGMWQRDGGGEPQLQSRLWSWKEIGPILEESLRRFVCPKTPISALLALTLRVQPTAQSGWHINFSIRASESPPIGTLQRRCASSFKARVPTQLPKASACSWSRAIFSSSRTGRGTAV